MDKSLFVVRSDAHCSLHEAFSFLADHALSRLVQLKFALLASVHQNLRGLHDDISIFIGVVELNIQTAEGHLFLIQVVL